MKRTISGMMGNGSIRHNNRSFIAKNVDENRTKDNIVFCKDNLKDVYEELFKEPLIKYNASKRKTRDKIPDYMDHIRNSKQEKLFYESIFQIGGMNDCACGTQEGDLAKEALKKFAKKFQERNPNLRVFNMILHLDEATPHLHVDYVPFATGQTRGLSTKTSLKAGLGQMGFKSQGRSKTEWNAWMDSEKEALKEIAQEYGFEIINLGGGRNHMKLPAFREATAELEIVKEQIATTMDELDVLENEKRGLTSSVQLLKKVDRVKVSMDDIEPTKALTGAVKGVTVEQVNDLKSMAIKGVAAEHEVDRLREENDRLKRQIPSVKEKIEYQKVISELKYENHNLKYANDYYEQEITKTNSYLENIIEAVHEALEYLEKHLPKAFLPVIEKVKDFIPELEIEEQEQFQKWEIEM